MNYRSILSQSLAGGFLQTATDVYWNGALTYFYIKNMGLSAKSASVVMVIFAFFNAFDNLIAGGIADRSHSKLGRRLPYIRVCGPLMGLFFCLSYFKLPFVTSQFGIAASFLLYLCLIDFCVAFLEVSLYSIPYEETLDKMTRGKVFIWQAVFMLLSIVVSMVLIPEIQPDSAEDAGTYRLIMCIVGVVCGMGIFLCSFFIDSTYRPDLNAMKGVSSLKYILDVFKNRAFLISEIYSVGSDLIYTVFMFGLYYYFDEICTDPLPCYVAAGLGVVAGLAIYFAMIRRFSVKFLATFSAILSGGLILIGFLVGGTVAGGAIACFGCGVQYVGYMLYSMLMLGDSLDADEAKTGLRREGVYNGIDCVLKGVTNAAQSMFLAIILAFGYVEGLPLGTQSERARYGITVAWLIPCVITLAISAVAVGVFYPLNQKAVKQNYDLLTARRKKEAEDGSRG